MTEAPITAVDLFVDQREPAGGLGWQMGVRPLDLSRWIVVDQHHRSELDEVARIIDDRPDETIVHLPGSVAACEELEALLVAHPGIPPAEPSAIPLHPIERARRMVQEDLCVLERGPQGWALTAAAVAAPTAWDVPSKLGLTLDGIHGPVPRYPDDLAPRMERFFDRLTADRPVWRSNWTLTDDPSLRLETPIRRAAVDPSITAANVGDRLWLRVEYQTLRRLPSTGAIVFTIRVLRQTLGDALAANGSFGPLLVDRLAAIPADVGRYKHSTVMYADVVDEWVRTLG